MRAAVGNFAAGAENILAAGAGAGAAAAAQDGTWLQADAGGRAAVAVDVPVPVTDQVLRVCNGCWGRVATRGVMVVGGVGGVVWMAASFRTGSKTLHPPPP